MRQLNSFLKLFLIAVPMVVATAAYAEYADYLDELEDFEGVAQDAAKYFVDNVDISDFTDFDVEAELNSGIDTAEMWYSHLVLFEALIYNDQAYWDANFSISSGMTFQVLQDTFRANKVIVRDQLGSYGILLPEVVFHLAVYATIGDDGLAMDVNQLLDDYEITEIGRWDINDYDLTCQQWLAMNRDADGDGVTNENEWKGLDRTGSFSVNAFDYVAAALDDSIVPTGGGFKSLASGELLGAGFGADMKAALPMKAATTFEGALIAIYTNEIFDKDPALTDGENNCIVDKAHARLVDTLLAQGHPGVTAAWNHNLAQIEADLAPISGEIPFLGTFWDIAPFEKQDFMLLAARFMTIGEAATIDLLDDVVEALNDALSGTPFLDGTFTVDEANYDLTQAVVLGAQGDADGDLDKNIQEYNYWWEIVTIGGVPMDDLTIDLFIADALNPLVAHHAADACLVDDTPPTLTLLGDNPMSLWKDIDVYIEPGATASDTHNSVVTDLTAEIVITGVVNTSVAAQYIVTYTVADMWGNTTEKKRTVEVIADTEAPVISMAPPVPFSFFLGDGTTIGDIPNATATDNIDGMVPVVTDTSAVDINTAGTYIVTYDAVDAAGNAAHEERPVIVVDPGFPIITINGDNPKTVVQHTVYNMPGATAKDFLGNNVPVTQVSPDPDLDTVGEYLIVYEASIGLNTSTATRIVRVVYPDGPVSVSSITPAEGDKSGGDTVIIAGTGMSLNVAENLVLFDGVPGTVIASSKPQWRYLLTVITPEHRVLGDLKAGTVDVKVQNTYTGSEATVVGGFKYTEMFTPPFIDFSDTDLFLILLNSLVDDGATADFDMNCIPDIRHFEMLMDMLEDPDINLKYPGLKAAWDNNKAYVVDNLAKLPSDFADV
ncbi:MAG: hypothetical protein QG656_1254, partial [Candidatus Hydrogenedentes bacterium]|nr:hypothetical protein [Candidatus Hydrogenedentota bacterium]